MDTKQTQSATAVAPHASGSARRGGKLYKATSLKSAEREVRYLRKQVAALVELVERLDRDSRLLAMLAADTPQFNNPLVSAQAKQLRDRILNLPNT